jgi:tetratricopeptide (TPR) repeat protein
MTEPSVRHALEAALKEAEAALAVRPDIADVRFQYANLLDMLGRREDAKAAYLEVLKRDPGHFGALTNFGNMLFAAGYSDAARTLYSEAVKRYPDNPKGHVNLANLLARANENALAFEHFEAALRLDPEHVEANRGMAYLLTESRDEARAALYRQKGFQSKPVLHLPYRGDGTPVRMLLLVSAFGGAIPMRHHLDDRIFDVWVIFVEFFDLRLALPSHDVIFNAIGDADLCAPALEAAEKLLSCTAAPVINRPEQVLLSGRMQNAARLGQIPNVVTAKTALFTRAALQATDANETLAAQGFAFPLLLRAPGFHTGQFFIRADDITSLAGSLPSMPGEEFLVMEYLDARDGDGKIRKYRVMAIDGVLYPLHAAVSHEWKIHYFTAEMADNPEHRAEDGAFLANMADVLGAKAMQALENIRDALGLDYGGMDFSRNAQGDIVLFEANATMVVYPPDKDSRWDYRRPAVQRILDAIYALLVKHAP